MADVYLAVSKGLARFNKLVVLKCLRKRWLEEEGAEDGARGDQAEFIEMFLEEARLAARLNHPNIVQTNEVGEESGDFYIAMEFLEGQSLNRIMNRSWRKQRDMSLELSIVVLCDALSALHHAHELKDFDGKQLDIVHRDASPHNIFVTYEGQTKLLDFGIAKAATRSFETRTGVLKGKIQYMAPEQAKCADVDRRADIFSIGVVLWELIAKKRMWAGMPDIQILQRLVTEPVPSITEAAPDVSPGLAAIVAKATALDPNDRYSTAEEMRSELYHWAKLNLPPTTSKEVGQLAAELFADKRALVAQIIEQQFSLIRRGEDINLNVMDPQTASASLSRAGLEFGEGQESSNPSHSASRRREGPATLATVAATGSFAPPRPKRTGLWVAMGAVALVGVIAAVSMKGLGGNEPVEAAKPNETTRAPAAATSAPAAGAEATPDSARAVPATADEPRANVTKLTITAKPDDAKIFIDDTPVDGNPYTGTFIRDAANHRLRVEADGHVTDKRLISFDDATKSVTVELSEKTAGVRYPRPIAKTPTPTNTATATVAPATATAASSQKGPGKPPKRELDKTNPYAVPTP